MKSYGVLMVGVCLLAPFTSHAQTFAPRKGADRVLRIPLEVGELVAGTDSSLQMRIEWHGDGILVNGRRDWEARGYVPAGAFEVKARHVDPQTKSTVIRLANDSSHRVVDLWLPADVSVAAMLWPILTYDEDERALADNVALAALSWSAFSSEYGALSAADKRALLIAARANSMPAKFSAEEFQTRRYLRIPAACLTTYNDAKLTANQRASFFVRDVLIPELRRFSEPLETSNTYGLAVTSSVAHSNFVRKGELPQTDLWRVFVSFDVIKKFRNAEITSQDLIDQAVVLINGDRTKVVLSDG